MADHTFDLGVKINDDGTVNVRLENVEPAHVALLFVPPLARVIAGEVWNTAVAQHDSR